jgi:hypothetical protein
MNARKPVCSDRERFLIAGIGGLAPVLLSLIVIDLRTLMLDATWLVMLSYGLRTVGLFIAGGIVGWLHKRETDTAKLFQLGITAPALITAWLNGSHVTLPENSVSPASSQESPVASLLLQLIPAAHADTEVAPGARAAAKQFALPAETPRQQIYRGFFGATPKNVWYVIAGSHQKIEDARKQVADLRQRGFTADVYAPYGGNPHYAVVIGAQLTLAAATQLRAKAVQSGLPPGTYLWTFPTQ